jgi:folylpolyglutamate synthase/dihydropteroate synthase
MADKDVDGVIGRSPAAHFTTLASSARHPAGGRALPADELAARWGAARAAAEAARRSGAALDAALSSEGAPRPVIVAGSLYLVGAARAILVPTRFWCLDPTGRFHCPRSPTPR